MGAWLRNLRWTLVEPAETQAFYLANKQTNTQPNNPTRKQARNSSKQTRRSQTHSTQQHDMRTISPKLSNGCPTACLWQAAVGLLWTTGFSRFAVFWNVVGQLWSTQGYVCFLFLYAHLMDNQVRTDQTISVVLVSCVLPRQTLLTTNKQINKLTNKQASKERNKQTTDLDMLGLSLQQQCEQQEAAKILWFHDFGIPMLLLFNVKSQSGTHNP